MAIAGAELEQTIERHIARRTCGRVHRLQATVHEDRLIVRGCTSSYYVKQLAIHAVLEVLDAGGDTAVDVDIEVGLSDPGTAQGYGGCVARG